ncbi:hypothetical protein A8W25_16445 [Streptomyces sp. ERV7]|nr:hypothetical protein A8W25_16445 [Streptomyces sp. ERV7]
MRRQAAGLSRDAEAVVGPLRGYHHETYAFPLPAENPLSARFERVKLRSPRPGLLWFDRRCFVSEDRLLLALRGRVGRVPECAEVVENVVLQEFIPGRTLGAGQPPGQPLSGRHSAQLADLFAELVSIEPDELRAECACAPEDRAPDGDSAAFLGRLIHFTENEVCHKHAALYEPLFRRLRVPGNVLHELKERAAALRPRPFSLLHGDLHRKNLIVDPAGDLWTIDWELAMIGDPLWDLATHLHLMRYPPREARRVGELWRSSVESARPGSSTGWEQDLPVLLEFKRVQSVYTDMMRAALALGPGPGPNWGAMEREARKVGRALAAAAGPMRLSGIPTPSQIMSAYAEWFSSVGPATRWPGRDRSPARVSRPAAKPSTAPVVFARGVGRLVEWGWRPPRPSPRTCQPARVRVMYAPQRSPCRVQASRRPHIQAPSSSVQRSSPSRQ